MLPALSSRSLRSTLAVVGLAVVLAACTPTAPNADGSAPSQTESPVVTYELPTGYTPTPTPTSSRADSCRIATAALDAATTALNQYASSDTTVAAFTSATTPITDAELQRLTRSAADSLGAYMRAPEGADATEEAAWDSDAQAIRGRCA